MFSNRLEYGFITSSVKCVHHDRKQMSRELDFQQCGILTSVDLDEPVQLPFKLRNYK